MTAVDLLHDRVLPFYDAHGVALERVLTNNGREFCGRPLHHPYELYYRAAAQAPDDEDRVPRDRWHGRTLQSDAEGRVLQSGVPTQVLRVRRGTAV